MRTNIDIDDATLREAQRLLGTHTKRETVDAALREVVARDRRRGLLGLRGTLRWEATSRQAARAAQGFPSENDAARVERHLRGFPILRLERVDDFALGAELYRVARRAGVTVRKTLDCLIAATCVRSDVPILHADRDFDLLARRTALRIHHALNA